jgi:nucleoside-diphosphate-sugar epimerase
MAIHKWIRGLFNDEPLVIYGDGEQTRDFTYVDDIIDGTLKSAETEGIEKEIFNLGSGCTISVNAVVKLILKLTNKLNIKPIYTQAKVGDVPHTQAEISKARNLLGYNPKTNLESGLRQFIDWYKAHLQII